MVENEPVLLTAEGKNGKIELTKTLLKIIGYKRGFMGKNGSNINEIPRDTIYSAEISYNDFYVFIPGDAEYTRFKISFEEEYRPDFENIADEIGLQGRWYEDNSKLSHIESYESEEEASKDADRAAKRGWKPLGSSSTDGHLNIGRTLARGLIFGAHRTKGKITITYDRTPEWLAANGKTVPQSSVLTSAPQPADDPVQKLKQLKEMLDAGLVSQEEYDATKAAVLSRM